MKFSELITKLHSASQPHMLMYIDIRSDCELADVNILASGQSDVQAGTLYFADAGQLTPDTVLPTNLLYYGTLPPELADRLTNSAMIDRGEFAVLFQTVKELLSYQQSDQQLYTQVLYMLCNGAELDRVLTKMTDVTGDLFVVIDSTGKLVAKTKNFYVDYTARPAHGRGGRSAAPARGQESARQSPSPPAGSQARPRRPCARCAGSP